MKVRVQIARSIREYADVIVEAPSVEAGEAYVASLLEEGESQAYCDMVNDAAWNSGDSFDEEVLDAEEHEDDDEEADVTVPDDFKPGSDAGNGERPFYAELRWNASDVQTIRPDLTDEQAEAFLARNEKHLRERLCERGFDIMGDLVSMDDEIPEPFKVGDRLYWTDPDAGLASGWGTIVTLQDEPLTEDTVISLKMDDQGEVEAIACELSREAPKP